MVAKGPYRRRKMGSIAIIRCSCWKKKLLLHWTWICGGANRTLFRNKRSFIGTLTCQVTAQNVPGFSEDKTVYAESNRKRKTTIITNLFIWNKVIIRIFLCYAFTTSIFFTSPSPIAWKSVKTADTLGTTKLGTCLDWKNKNKQISINTTRQNIEITTFARMKENH